MRFFKKFFCKLEIKTSFWILFLIMIALGRKEQFFIILSFVTFNGVLSASKDSITARTLKFSLANLVPIIGSSVGDAIKNVTSGIKYISSYVGATTAWALLITAFPILIKLIAFKLVMRSTTLISGLIGASEITATFDSFSDIADIFLALIIATLIASFMFVLIFLLTPIYLSIT